jgi:hypothetical protein
MLNVNKATTQKEMRYTIMMNVIKKFAEAFNENKASVICGMAMMCGNANAYAMYAAMTNAECK